ncbi:hypothetical protein [Halpernia sp. GG3]
MKKFIFLSIVLVSLSLFSCREQDEMAQLNNVQKTEFSKTSSTDTNSSVARENFDSSLADQGDPAKPPRD